MKILHILDHSLPLHSGYTFRSQNIFRSQNKMGWQPVILTSPKHEASWKGQWHSRETINGFVYYRTGAVNGSRLPILGELQLMNALNKRLKEVIIREKPDILHAHSPVLNALPALNVGKQLGIPVVYEIRAFWEDAAVDHGTYAENAIKYRMTRAVETYVCQKAAHVAVLCNGLKQDLITRGISTEKITPVFNGVNPDDFKPTPPDTEYQTAWNLRGKKVIGFIGSFYRYEGLDLLINAFKQIAPKHPDTVLLLVGGGEMTAELKKLCQPNDPVLFSGRIPHERVPGVYSMIDILAYPRYPMRLTELVTPLKPLEAMAMGKALIASDVGGHKELIHHNDTGLLFPAGDENALAETLDKLLSGDETRNRLAQNGAAWVRRYHTWEATTAVYSKVYSLIR
jgi:PEP-CTERM/exosortase A-associated glycosyltransferase